MSGFVVLRASQMSSGGAGKDTESEVQSQQTGQGELQLVVEQRAVWENPLLDAGLHWTLTRHVKHRRNQLSVPHEASHAVQTFLPGDN